MRSRGVHGAKALLAQALLAVVALSQLRSVAQGHGLDLLAAGKELLAQHQEQRRTQARSTQAQSSAPAGGNQVEDVFASFQECAKAYEMESAFLCVEAVLLPTYVSNYDATRCEASSTGVLDEEAQADLLALVESFVEEPTKVPDLDDCQALFAQNGHLGQCVAALNASSLGNFIFAASLNSFQDHADACAPVAQVASYVNATLIDEASNPTSIPGVGANSTESTQALTKLHELAAQCEEISAGITTSAYPSVASRRYQEAGLVRHVALVLLLSQVVSRFLVFT
ncbi:Hypothetical Protein FCC1311_040592 [Hondaea fermentalgiana]|uniref:Uncharacterized protein n=1 Tax=Hondaea fermentalgiana TaxID=2315210 RepID=A0A2R5G9V7_9STRA|nr:Hypothetical Protein FCC1311_040592 [Hondaea fermentalgiana]|eukprot:GBG27836.1 Hypothetical Protein FCC1311_040592 [Hondaea fermentalgiana]